MNYLLAIDFNILALTNLFFMKHLISLALFACTLSASAQNLLQETMENWRGNVWQNAYQKSFQYDNNQHKTLEFGSNWNIESQKWVNNALKFYTYNEGGQETERIEKIWNASIGEWINTKKSTYTYVGTNQSNINYRWVNGTWTPNEQFLITSDANGDIIELINNYWNAEGNTWVLENKEVYEYLSKGKISVYTLQVVWPNTTTLENKNKKEYTYNAQGKKSLGISKSWNPSTNEWINSSRTNFNYNPAGHLIEEIYEMWDLGQQAYLQDLKITYEKNAKGEILNTSYFKWDIDKKEWKFSFRQNNQLNEFGLATEIIKQNFDPEVLVWQNSERITKVYSGTTGLAKASLQNFNVFPNPVKEQLTIQGFILGNTSYEIYTLDGKLMLDGFILNQETSIEVNALKKGVYFLKIQGAEGTFVQKLIKE